MSHPASAFVPAAAPASASRSPSSAALALVTATRGVGNYDVCTIAVDDRPVVVTLRLGHDGVEYVGRLWFADPEAHERELVEGIPDRAALSGRTATEVVTRVTNLRSDDLHRRHDRAMADRRRFRGLREATDEMLARIRYLNRVALLVRDGLLDAAGGEQELDATEAQLHELVAVLRSKAGRQD